MNCIYQSDSKAISDSKVISGVILIQPITLCAPGHSEWSQEAKALGIPMGAPFFQYQKLIQNYEVQVYSSNYALYGDMSQRVMETLKCFSPHLEVYSIDEAFLDLTGFKNKSLTEYGILIRNTVKRYIGIPVTIGIVRRYRK
jgi:nucleotidyltransferase/DNA polymerase involved in DNA repair